MLPNSARIKSSSDFARTTKLGRRFSNDSLICYLYSSKDNHPAKLGLIISKSVGNSVVRHRIARQVRHAVRDELKQLPNGTLFVVRAMKNPQNAFIETKNLLTKITKVNA